MEFIDKLLKKPLWVNMLAGIGAILVLLILFFFSLGWITGNGKTEKVPNVLGLDVLAAEKNIKTLGFDLVLQDSIYVDTLARNSVLRQTPEADEVVKKGRTIFLTINRVIAPQVDMPNLIGFSLKSAQTYLKVLGLRIGTINLVADRNKNVIVEQLVGNTPIAPGTKIVSGTLINFTVGDGGASIGMEVPDLIGLTVAMAKMKITSMGLLVGNITANVAIQDTANAFVVQQNPSTYSSVLDSLGMPVKNVTIQGVAIDLVIDKVAPVIIKRDSLK
ncbi:MAG: PASTA domain-containing protein [Chitinophagia bacterium]|nr:PASTA domain-containing protein [Chitinophagia bacterium]NDD16818.1 PASTA domain-containing protein [Chitinophagia bacterium]